MTQTEASYIASPSEPTSMYPTNGDLGPDTGGAPLDTVKQDAADFLSAAQDKASASIKDGKVQAAKTMQDFAGAIRKAGEELGQHDQSMAGQMVRQAADGLERFARSVSDKRPSEMLDAVRDFGRENPVAFAAGSVLMGLAVGRFMRSSEHHANADQSPSTGRNSSGVEAAQVYGLVDPHPYASRDNGAVERTRASTGSEI